MKKIVALACLCVFLGDCAVRLVHVLAPWCACVALVLFLLEVGLWAVRRR